MFKQLSLVCTSALIIHSASLIADQPGEPLENEADSIFTKPMSEPLAPFLVIEEPSTPAQESGSSQETPVSEPPVVKKIKTHSNIKPFTGSIKRNKVRLRLHPDTESPIVQELNKGSLLSVVGESDDFWAVEAPQNVKAYIFRSFVLDGQVEGNHVNVRLSPSTEAPILTHLNSGDTVEGTICNTNNKWLEIAPPKTTKFYVAKNYVENLGGPELKVAVETKRAQAEQDLLLATQFAESEIQKSFPNIDLDKINNNFQTIIQEYASFSDLTEKAQELLTKMQEQFLDKRIGYLESKTFEDEALSMQANHSPRVFIPSTDKMKIWEPVEEALYLSWVNMNEGRDMDEYYEDQKLAAVKITGLLEAYSAPVKSRPGDYFIKQDGLPVGYVYSTKINLEEFVGKK
jgi:SH3-like domain-containing protein